MQNDMLLAQIMDGPLRSITVRDPDIWAADVAQPAQIQEARLAFACLLSDTRYVPFLLCFLESPSTVPLSAMHDMAIDTGDERAERAAKAAIAQYRWAVDHDRSTAKLRRCREKLERRHNRRLAGTI